MRARPRTLALAGALAWLGCASVDSGAASEPRAFAPASLAVEVYGGLDASRAPSESAARVPAVEFRVIAVDDPSHVLASGRAGEGAVSVAPGMVTLLVQLDPLERIGPFRLEPGAAARVRVLETFDAALPSRIWRLERGDEVVGRVFPPPDELPATRREP